MRKSDENRRWEKIHKKIVSFINVANVSMEGQEISLKKAVKHVPFIILQYARNKKCMDTKVQKVAMIKSVTNYI